MPGNPVSVEGKPGLESYPYSAPMTAYPLVMDGVSKAVNARHLKLSFLLRSPVTEAPDESVSSTTEHPARL